MRDLLRTDRPLILDGAMGTVLQQRGLPPGGQPEILAVERPELIREIHREYVEAGSRIVYTDTFGANALKLAGTGRSVSETIGAAVRAAREAAGGDALVALDIGPLGGLLEPLGTLTFERAWELFREMAEAGAGADLAVIETMTDLYEAKAALLAVKERTDLPVFVTMSFDEGGRTFTGCTVPSMAHTLEGLGADAIGFNCSLGPDRMVPLIEALCAETRLPVIAKPNAGLPDPVDGQYDMDPDAFAEAVRSCVDAGASIVGGCCGTSPAYVRRLREVLGDRRLTPRRAPAAVGCVCTPTRIVRLDGIRTIGERIDPTGKKRLQQALLEEDLDYVLDLAVRQEDAGADLLDVNVGHPGVEERTMLPKAVKRIQSAVSAPLQLDSSDPEALAAALRVYDGKAAVNSVNGDREVLDRILPMVRKYGAAVVGLTLDRGGIPETAAARIEIAERILDAALSHGIPREDVWIDCLTLTVSAQQGQARETLEAVRYVREKMGLQTVLGVSNISFGLPERPLLARTFLTQALQAGLTLPILDPNKKEMMDAVAASRALSGEDAGCRAYVERFAPGPEGPGSPASPASSGPSGTAMGLEDAVVRGLKTEAGRLAAEALETEEPLSLVEGRLIPALDRVGAGYEAGTVFLPQLLSAAQAAQAVFEKVRAAVAERGGDPVRKGKLIVATVRGDIHDIGKNIAKTVLENYGYEVLDLGRDVPPETIAEQAAAHKIRLVGLSALMTTTLPAMEETVRRLRALPDPPVTYVAGAVVTPEHAARMGADRYAKDARASVEIAREVLG